MRKTRFFLALLAAGLLLAPAVAQAQYHTHHHYYHPRSPRRVLPPPPQVEAKKEALPSQKDLFLLGLGIRGVGIALDGYKLHLSDLENPVMGGVGVHFRSKFTRHWGLEIAVDYLRGEGQDFVQWSVPVSMSALVYFLPDSRINPYALFGGGIHFTSMEYDGGRYTHDIVEFAGHLGGGVQIRIVDSFAIHADLRFLGIYKNLGDEVSVRDDCQGYCDGLSSLNTNDRFNIGLQFQAGATYFF